MSETLSSIRRFGCAIAVEEHHEHKDEHHGNGHHGHGGYPNEFLDQFVILVHGHFQFGHGPDKPTAAVFSFLRRWRRKRLVRLSGLRSVYGGHQQQRFLLLDFGHGRRSDVGLVSDCHRLSRSKPRWPVCFNVIAVPGSLLGHDSRDRAGCVPTVCQSFDGRCVTIGHQLLAASNAVVTIGACRMARHLTADSPASDKALWNTSNS